MASASDKAKGRVLLPQHTTPSRYDVTLTPDLDKFTFDGQVIITVAVSAETTSITLHSKELAISAAVFEAGDKKLKAEAINFNLKLTTVELVFGETLPQGDGKLTIDFLGQLNDQMAGFYRSKYTDINGVERYMASTQFEALDARRCLPCWDEPAMKAVFGVTLVVPVNRVAFSNMPESNSTELKNGKRKITFMDTPAMSSYLLAFCVGEFDFVQAKTQHGVLVRVYTVPGKGEMGTFSLDCAVRTLDMYDDYFNVPYPLPKLDMVAVPEFAMGAMENWGLVTYREVDLLIDDVKASAQQRQRVCTVVTHELAHQWFGNLVTMRWWDDLWLNEGFASWMQTYAANFLFKEWCMWEQFIVDDQGAALRLDALRSSHPIQVPIAHAEEVEQVFDAISYCKGASVIKMIHAVLGPEKFQKGLQDYMEKHKYSNTETFDLWAAWENASQMPVKSMMASWTEQMGFPVLKVTNYKKDGKKVSLTLEQEWFLADGSSLSEEEQKKTWTIPVIANDTQKSVTLVSEKTKTVDFEVDASFVKLNFGQHVPIRVQYSEEMLTELIAAVKSKSLPPADRAGLVLDTLHLVKVNRVDPAQLFKLLNAYKEEDNAIVWDALSQVLGAFDKVLKQNKEIHAWFVKFASELITPAFNRVGWQPRDDDDHLAKMLRATMVSLLGTFSNDPSVIEEARKRFDAVVSNPKDAEACPSDFKTTVFKIIMRNGGEEEYNKAVHLIDTYDVTAEKKQIMHALGYASDPALKLRTLDWTTSGAVKLQDFFYPIASVSSSSNEGLEISWKYFQDNFDRLHGMVAAASPSLFNAVIVYSCGGFASASKADEIEAFFKEHPVPQSARRIEQALENIRNSGAFLDVVVKSDASKESFWKTL